MELLRYGTWLPVCRKGRDSTGNPVDTSGHFDDVAAAIVCSQLGYAPLPASVEAANAFGTPSSNSSGEFYLGNWCRPPTSYYGTWRLDQCISSAADPNQACVDFAALTCANSSGEQGPLGPACAEPILPATRLTPQPSSCLVASAESRPHHSRLLCTPWKTHLLSVCCSTASIARLPGGHSRPGRPHRQRPAAGVLGGRVGPSGRLVCQQQRRHTGCTGRRGLQRPGVCNRNRCLLECLRLSQWQFSALVVLQLQQWWPTPDRLLPWRRQPGKLQLGRLQRGRC